MSSVRFVSLTCLALALSGEA
ncbi:MAG: hypothetical protein RJB09_38, partial [Pseudomonadota bacterium]